MAGEIDPKTGLLLQAPAGSTIDANGVVNRTPRYTADGAPVVAPPIDPNIPTAATGNPYGTDATGKPLPAPAGTTPIMNYDQFVADQKSKTAVDEAAIREQVRKEQQTRIDAVNNSYNSMVAEAGVTGQDRLGQSRALQSRSGLLGSDFGASQTDKVTKVNQSEVAAINAERDMKIQGVMDKIDQTVTDRVKAQKEEAAGNITAFNDYVTKAKADAQDHIKTLATSNVDLAKYKEQAPDNYKNLLQSSGYGSEFEFGFIYNAMKDKENQIKYDWMKVGDSIVGIGTDPSTGKPVKSVFSAADLGLPDSANLDFQTAGDGQVYYYNKENPKKDADGNVILQKVGGQKPVAPKKPIPPKDDAEKSMTDQLSAVKGADGFISPQDYTKARNAWVEAGYTPTAFDTKFKGFKNPNNPNYTTTKAPASKKRTLDGG